MKNNNKNQGKSEQGITRKEALKKAGRYAAFTAASMLIVLNPKESQAQSPGPAKLPVW